jgi:GNAT superfamily N-acetyltransferase
MTHHMKNQLQVTTGTEADLAAVLVWLRREYETSGESYWINRDVITDSARSGVFRVVRLRGKAVGFRTGPLCDGIVAVAPKYRRRGIGTALVDDLLADANRAGVTVLRGGCEPRSALPFWLRRGFEGHVLLDGGLVVRRVLTLRHPLPGTGKQFVANVKVYESERHSSPLETHSLVGELLGDRLRLEQRVVATTITGGGYLDMVVDVTVGAVHFGRHKIKRREVVEMGFALDPVGCAAYVDVLHVKNRLPPFGAPRPHGYPPDQAGVTPATRVVGSP